MAERNQAKHMLGHGYWYRKNMQRATSGVAAASSTSAASASVPADGNGAEAEIAETLILRTTSAAHPAKSQREPMAFEDWQHRRSQHHNSTRRWKHRHRKQNQECLDDLEDKPQQQQNLAAVAGFALGLPLDESRAAAEERIAMELALAESALEGKGAAAELLDRRRVNTIGKLLDRSKDIQGDYVIDWNWCLDKDNVSCSSSGLLFSTTKAAKSLNSKFADHLKIEKLQRWNKEQNAPGGGVFFQSDDPSKTTTRAELPLYLHYFKDEVQVSHVSPVHMAPKHMPVLRKAPSDYKSLPHKVFKQEGGKLRPLDVDWSSPNAWLIGNLGRSKLPKLNTRSAAS